MSYVTDCAGLTTITNCATCSEKPDANSTAPCHSCAAGFTLKDSMQTGEGTECICMYHFVKCSEFVFCPQFYVKYRYSNTRFVIEIQEQVTVRIKMIMIICLDTISCTKHLITYNYYCYCSNQ